MADFQYEYTPPKGSRRRITVEELPTGGHTRLVEEWTGCSWRAVGREPVMDVVVGNRE